MDTFPSIPAHVISSEVGIVYIREVARKGKRQHLNNDNIRGRGLPCENASGAGDRKVPEHGHLFIPSRSCHLIRSKDRLCLLSIKGKSRGKVKDSTVIMII